jgi:hypothetical protein
MMQLEGYEIIREVCRTYYSITYQAKKCDDNLLFFVKLYPKTPKNDQLYRWVHVASSQAMLHPT